MNAAVGLGISVSAMAAIILTQSKKRNNDLAFSSESACTNAMMSNTVSARAEEGFTDEPSTEDTSDVDTWQHGLWGLDPDAESQMRKASIPKSEEFSKRVRDAKMAVKPMYVESLGKKGLGATIPVIGRSTQDVTPPAVSGGCMFYMSDSYTRALEQE